MAEEVNRICGSPAFRRAKTQTRLLRYLAGEAIAGRGDELNQYLIATDGMGLAESFDPTADATVRVWGVRLRRMLADYYRGPGRKNPLRIRLPARSYCPEWEASGTAATAPHETDKLPTVAVVEFRGIGLRGAWRHYPAVLAENLMAALTAMQSVEAVGPFGRSPRVRDSAFPSHGANFILDGSVEALLGGLRLRARLLRGSNGAACWAEIFETKIHGDRIPRADLPAAARLAAVLGDDFGVIRREVVRSSLGRPVESLPAQEAIMRVWRSWLSMGPRDIATARTALQFAMEAGYATPQIKAFAAMNLFDSWATSLQSNPNPPPHLSHLAAEAHREDPENAWVLLANLCAFVAQGEVVEAATLARQLEAHRATTPSLRIVLAYMCLAYRIGPGQNALRLWRHAMRVCPSPMAVTFVGPAIHAVTNRRWPQALAWLKQASECDLPLYPLLLATTHAGMGNKKDARRELSVLRKKIPRFPAMGEEIYRRNAHPAGWVVIKSVLSPIAPEMFTPKQAAGR